MAEDRPPSTASLTPDALVQLGLREGAAGIRRAYAEHSRGLEPLEAHTLLLSWCEALLPLPGVRGALIDQVGPALNALSRAGQLGLVLRGLATAARCQIEEGVWIEVPGLLGALTQLADRLDAAPYQALARLLHAQAQLAQGQAEEGVAGLNSLIEDLEPVAAMPAAVELLRRAFGLLAEHGLAAGDLRALEGGVQGLRGLPGADRDPVVALHAAWAARMRRRDEDAIREFQALLGLAQQGIDPAWAIEAHLGLAELLPWEADAHLAQAEALAQARGAGWVALRVQLARARGWLTRGQLGAALGAAAQLEREDDPRALALAVEIRLTAGEGEAVRPAAERLLSQAKARGNPGSLALANLYLGMSCADPQEKAVHFDAAQAWAAQAGDAALRSRALAQMSLLASAAGSLEAAVQAASLAEEEARGVGELAAVAFALLARGHAEPAQAAQHFQRALELAERAGDTALRIRALTALGRLDEAAHLRGEAGLPED